MPLDATAHSNLEGLGRRLTGIYVRVTLWYLLGVALLWLVGFESIYGHPTPFYALYLPAFDSVVAPGVMAAVIGLAYWVGSRRYLTRTPRRYRAGLAGWCVFLILLAGLLYQEAAHRSQSFPERLLADGRLLMWHVPAVLVFLGGLAAVLHVFGRSSWFWREESPAEPPHALEPQDVDGAGTSRADFPELWFLVAVVAFLVLFACAVAMIRNGPEGIAQAYRRETYEYIGDIGVTRSIRALFSRYLKVQSYLSLHARAAPPGPIALLWVLSYVVGRGAMALSLATAAAGSLAVIPLYYWVRDLAGARVAALCCLVYALIPSIVLFTATSAEILFMPFTLTTLFLFDRAIRRNSLGYALGAGAGFAAMSLLKFTLLGVGAYFVLVGLWMLRSRETRRNVFQTAAVMLAAFLACHLALWWWTGFDVIACFKSSKVHFDMDQAKLDQITPRFPGWIYRFLNPLTFFYFAGIPVSLLFLWRLRWPERDTKARFLVFALTLLALNVLYLSRGEGERSALYIFPFLAVPAAHALDELCRKARSVTPLAATLAFLAFQCWLTESYFYTYW